MDLHRAEAADWDRIPADRRNYWQRLAARTNSIVTPGNLVTIFGGLVVLVGLYKVAYGSLGTGIILILLGRSADILDGMIAERTQTKSTLGEAVDAATDKTLTILALIVILTQHYIPSPVGLIIIIQNIYNSLLSLIAKHYKADLHPTLSGKVSAVFEWFSVIFYLIGHFWQIHDPGAGTVARWGAGVTFVVYLVLGGWSSWQYSRDFYQAMRRR